MSSLASLSLPPFNATNQVEHNEPFLVNDFLLYDNDDSITIDDSFQVHDNDLKHAEVVGQLSSNTELTPSNGFLTPFTPYIDTFAITSFSSTPFTPAVRCFSGITVPYSPDLRYGEDMPLFTTPLVSSMQSFDIPMSNSASIDTPLTLSLDGFDTEGALADSYYYGFSDPSANTITLDTPFIQDVNEFALDDLTDKSIHPVTNAFSPAFLNGTPNIFSESIDMTPFLTPATDFEYDNFSAPGTPVDIATVNTFKNISYLQLSSEINQYNNLCKIDPSSQSFPLFAPLEEIADSHQPIESSTSILSSLDKDTFTAPAPQRSTKLRLAITKNKKYVCSYYGCNKSFARKFNLNVHVRSHYPELARPFKCTECSKAFGRKHDLTRHLAAVHKATSLYHCSECEKEFSRRDALVRHLEKGCRLV